MRFRFRPWFTLFAVVGVVIAASLGFWQLGRHRDKQARADAIAEGLEQAPATATDLSGPPEGLLWRKIRVQGRFVDDPQLLGGRLECRELGYGLVQPFQIDGGPRVLIDRGWIPREGAEQHATDLAAVGELRVVQGQVRPIEGELDLVPLPSSEGSRFTRWPPGAYAQVAAADPNLAEVMIWAGDPLRADEEKDCARLPVTGYNPYPRTRDSLSYAFQWWLIGGVLIVVWAAFSIARDDDEDAPTEPPPAAA